MELRAENIGFRYGAKGREIWRNYNISIKSGERLGLMAPSGYGKTTLLKLLAGYERPDEGSVFLDGKPLSEYGGYCPVQLIWQHPEEALNPRLKMKHALKQGGGVSPRIAEGLGIQDEWLERYPSELSGGEQQRVAIARALVNRPAILIADEPTGNLDPQNAWELMDVLQRINEKGTTIVMATHAKDIVDAMHKRVIMLSEGHIVYDEAEGGYHEVTVL